MPTPLTFRKGETISTQLVDNQGRIETNIHNALIEARILAFNIVSTRFLPLDQRPIDSLLSSLIISQKDCNHQLYLNIQEYKIHF